jgi:hypothetical protein
MDSLFKKKAKEHILGTCDLNNTSHGVLPLSHQTHDKFVKVEHPYFVRLVLQQSWVFLQMVGSKDNK